MELEAVFAMDWYTETGEKLGAEIELVTDPEVDQVPMQLLPSGPGYLTIPNLRLFTGLVHRAQHKLSLTSPYFVPDDSLLEAITTAAYRGVAVELFVSEQADQFMVQTRSSLLLRRAAGGRGADLPVSQADCVACQALHRRRHGRHHRIQQHGLPLVWAGLRNHADVDR